MDEVGRSTWSFIFLAVLIIFSAFFYTCEISIIGANEHKLKKLIDEHSPKSTKAKCILALKEDATRFVLCTNMIGTLCIAGSIALSTVIFAPLLSNAYKMLIPAFNADLSLPLADLENYAIYIIAFFLGSFVSIVLGFLLPKKVTNLSSDNFAFTFIYLFRGLMIFFTPFVALCAITTKLILKLFRVNMDVDNSEVTEEEIRMMIDAGNESGSIETSEKEMLNNVFEFDDRTAVEIMTHRTNIIAVEKNQKLNDITFLAINEGFSRIPVYEESIDNIIGIIYVKDLLCLVGNEFADSFDISHFLRKVIYIPGTSKCGALLREFKQKKVHVAVVVDEYGGTDGIITMEDLLESIVGNIEDEYDTETPEFTQIDEKTYILDGSINVLDLEELLDINIPQTDDGDTIAGIILNMIGYIPTEDQHPSVQIDGYTFTVLSIDERRIEKVKVTRNIATDVEQITKI